MTGHAKKIDTFSVGRTGSDYGAIFPSCCDSELRQRIVTAIYTARSDESCPIDRDELREIATYISELEEFILRQFWGEAKPTLEDLKMRSGLNIPKQIEVFNQYLTEE